MNEPTDPFARDLAEALRRSAGSGVPTGDAHPVDLAAVRGRARGIRRTRRTVAAVGVLAAAAVVAPVVALALPSNERSSAPDPAGPPSLDVRDRGEVALTGVDAPRGDAPATGWLSGLGDAGVLHTPGGAEFSLAPAADAVAGVVGGPADGREVRWRSWRVLAPVADRSDADTGDTGEVGEAGGDSSAEGTAYVVLGSASEGGGSAVVVLDGDGDPLGEAQPASNDVLVGTLDGTVAAYTTGDGDAGLLDASGRGATLAAPVSLQTPAVVGLDGADGACAPAMLTAGCRIVVEDRGERPQVLAWRPAAAAAEQVTVIPDVVEVTSVSGDVATAVQEATEFGTRSGLYRLDGDRAYAWTQEAYLAQSLSPDGRLVAATDAYESGLGGLTVAFLDSRTGDRVVAFQVPAPPADEPTQPLTTFGPAVWEDDRHLLVVVNEGGSSLVLRLGVDGTIERATDPVRENVLDLGEASVELPS